MQKGELTELEKKLHQEKYEEARLNESVVELQKKYETLEAEVKRHRDLRQSLDLKINPMKVS